ncbi:MAG: hypothetical protein ACTSR3_19625 [Candidatus Helarchaeota archaeon]
MELNGEYILIVGGGKAGKRAFKYGKEKKSKIIVIDSDLNCEIRNFIDYFLEPKDISEIDEIATPTESILIQGGIETAFKLIDKIKFSYIFPCVPQHLAARLVIHNLTRIGRKVVPDPENLSELLKKIPSNLVFNFDKEKAIVVLSYMPKGSDCLDDCTSPDICPVTGIKKEVPLFKLLRSKIPDIYGIVIESKQIKAGLGAIEGRDLEELFSFTKDKKKLFVATASRCHGIINALKVT